jgi:hypothetical protein
MEDTQPNEVRLARKGSTYVPHVRTTRPVHAPYRGPPSSCDPRPYKRIRWQPAPLPSFTDRPELQPVEVCLPRECHKGAPGCRGARKRWIEDQKYQLSTDRRLSVVSFKYLDWNNSVLFTCRTQQATQSTGHHATGYSNPPVLLQSTKFYLLRQHGGEFAPCRYTPAHRKHRYHTTGSICGQRQPL